MQLFGCLSCDLQDIGENPFNPRQLGDDDEQRRLATLQESIEKYGLFDAPLLAKVEGFKGLIPISGNRRIAALEKMGIREIPYTPIQWRGYPETIPQQLCADLTLWIQRETKPHDVLGLIRITDAIKKHGLSVEDLPKGFKQAITVIELLERHPELKKLVYSKNRKKTNPRQSVGWSVIHDILKRCNGDEKRIMHHIDLYVKGVHQDQRAVRRAIDTENREAQKCSE